MARIIAIDDENGILQIIKRGLESDGHFVYCYSSPEEVSPQILQKADLMLLDVMMPDIDGFEYCKQIRGQVDFPIVFLTAKMLEEDITLGLAIGGDDYLVKPFRLAELRARVNAHLRREGREKHHRIRFDNCEIDLDEKLIIVNGNELKFTRTEFSICEYLAKNKGRTFTKDQIYDNVFESFGEGDSSTISTHVRNIRTKFAQYDIEPIQTVWGIGYKWI